MTALPRPSFAFAMPCVARFLGVDPGVSGGIAILSSRGHLSVHDMPTCKVLVARKQRREVDALALAELLRPLADGAVAIVERQSARPGQGVTGMFGLGRSLGVVLGVMAGLGIPVRMVAASAWKPALDVPADKGLVRSRASELLPAGAGDWRRKKDHGRAEAALLALYGLTEGGGACATP